MSDEFRIGIPPDHEKGEAIFRSHNIGDVYTSLQKSYNLSEIHKKYTGKGVKIAVLDTGYYGDHPDLKVAQNKDFTKSPTGVKDIQGHGAHVYGIIAMQKNNQGMVGISFDSDFFVGKVLGDDGMGSMKAIADGIRASAANGCHYINLSLGAPHEANSRILNDAIAYAYDRQCYCIVASGNESKGKVGYPARLPNVIACGAVKADKKLAWFSNKGVAIDAVQYGTNIVSVDVATNDYLKMSGTSQATPALCGHVALFDQWYREHFNKRPDFQNIMHWLKSTALDLGDDGHDSSTGFGFIAFSPSACAKAFGIESAKPAPIPTTPIVPPSNNEEVIKLTEKVKSLKREISRLKRYLKTARAARDKYRKELSRYKRLVKNVYVKIKKINIFNKSSIITQLDEEVVATSLDIEDLSGSTLDEDIDDYLEDYG